MKSEANGEQISEFLLNREAELRSDRDHSILPLVDRISVGLVMTLHLLLSLYAGCVLGCTVVFGMHTPHSHTYFPYDQFQLNFESIGSRHKYTRETKYMVKQQK